MVHIHTRTILALAIILFGLFSVWETIALVYSSSWRDLMPISSFYMFSHTISSIVLLIPGIFCLYFGLKSLREPKRQNIQTAAAWLIVGIALPVSSFVLEQFQPEFSAMIALSVTLSLILLALILFYRLNSMIVVSRGGIRTGGYRDALGKPIVLLLAADIWLVVTDLFALFSPKAEGFKHVPDDSWAIAGFVVPTVLALGLYRFAARSLCNKRTKGVTN